jgi:hypothetical protein
MILLYCIKPQRANLFSIFNKSIQAYECGDNCRLSLAIVTSFKYNISISIVICSL